jgi:gliding-associated putative ABC transporter substrate-binding component GldG
MVAGWKQSKKIGDLLWLANALLFVLILNVLGSSYFFRVDLTDEKRYTIKPQTKALLKNLDDAVYVEVFLEGDLNPGFERFKKSIRETLEEFRIYSNDRVQYTFTDPNLAMGARARNEFIAELNSKGIAPRNVIENKDGQRVEKLVFPGALVSYGGLETGVMLLKGNAMQGSQQVLNQAIEGIEFELANAIHQLTNLDRKRIGFVSGHGELNGLPIASFENTLREQYDLGEIKLTDKAALSEYDALILAKPTRAFSNVDKYNLDQYLMKGGRILFLLDRLDAAMDSASSDNYFAFPYDLNLDDQLFKYGIRINQDLIQDRVAGRYPIVVSDAGKPQIMQMEWPFFPLINQYADHPITRNLDASLLKFTSTIDTIKAAGVKKTPLLFSSPFSRKAVAPVKVGVNDLRNQLQQTDSFNEGKLPVGYLLEGTFTSLFKNRFAPEGADAKDFLPESATTKLMVIADGDIIRNDVNPRDGSVQPLGFDPFSQYTFANQDLLMNAIAYLLEEDGLINARSKEIKIRPLDKEKIKKERVFWQVFNLLVPLLVVVIVGLFRSYLRKIKYAKF